MQTPRERLLTALAHRQPERVPFSWGFGPTPEMAAQLRQALAARGLDWDRLHAATDDKLGVGPAYHGPPVPDGNLFTGIWGIRLRNMSYGGGAYQEFTDFPLAGVTEPAALAKHPWPDPSCYAYAGLRAAIMAANPERTKATCYFAGNPFELYCWLTGLEEALVNVAANPAVVTAALEHITGIVVERLRRTLAAAGDLIDLVFFADDLGGQQGLLVSRATYRRLIQPFHRRIAECARQGAPHAHRMFHSDGAVFEVIPDLLDAGVDVLEAVQVDAAGMDPVRLKATYGDRLSFHGAISVQQLLPHGDAATVARECRRLVDVLGDGGGYIAAPCHAIQVGTPPENVLAMLRAVLGDEDFERALAAAAR